MSNGARDPYAALRHAGYRHFLAGNFLSTLGRQAMNVAAAWQIYQWTNSATALGLVGFVNVLPLLVLTLPAGVLADRVDRRVILRRAMAASALLSGALAAVSFYHARIPAWPVLAHANEALRSIAIFFERHADPTTLHFDNPALPLVYLLLFGSAIVRVLSSPARAAIVPLLIPGSALGNAVTWSSSAFELSTVVGPAFGGIIVAVAGYSAVYALDMAACVAFGLLLLGVKFSAAPAPASTERPAMFAGVSFMWNNKRILGAMTLDLFAVLLGGATALLPIYADKILHVGPVGLGWLRAAPAIGAIAMAMITTHLPPARRPGILMLWSVAGFGAAIGIFSVSTTFWLSLVALFFTGVFDNVSVVVRHSLVQLMTPDVLRGRVTAVNQLFIGSSNEISAMRAGFSAALFGPVLAAGVGGIGTILVTLGIAYFVPSLRSVPPLNEIKPEPREPSAKTS
ncbi:MFS transporter [Oleiharenicola lentus]|uniref:MFS transporter n=1 Tax=Oleiharenicola lentus TaxID=2508720 RepID=UPI003F674C9A